MTSKISKIKGVELILVELSKGVKKVEIMANFGKLWQTPKDTFNKWYKIALEEHTNRNEAKEAIRLEQTTQTLKEAINEAILSDLEIEAVLCNIIKGKYQVEQIIKGDVVLREVSPLEIVSAAKVIYAKRGSNAPTKTDITTNTIKIEWEK